MLPILHCQNAYNRCSQKQVVFGFWLHTVAATIRQITYQIDSDSKDKVTNQIYKVLTDAVRSKSLYNLELSPRLSNKMM